MHVLSPKVHVVKFKGRLPNFVHFYSPLGICPLHLCSVGHPLSERADASSLDLQNIVFGHKCILKVSVKEGGLTPAVKPQIGISTHGNANIFETIWTFSTRFFLDKFVSSRYVHFRGVLYHLSMFLYPHTGLFEKLSVLGFF